MSRRISVTERVLEDRPVGRGLEAIIDGTREENDASRGVKNTRHAEDRPANQESGNLVEATFLLDPESLAILDRIWLRHQKGDGHSKSALVREAIRWFRAKPGNRTEQILEAISAVVNRAVVKGRGASRTTIVGIVTPVFTVVGSLFIGGALWLAQGGHRGAGDAMGIGILASLGVTLILLGFGTALTFIVTHLTGLPSEAAAGDGAAPQEGPVKQTTEAPQAARPKRVPRPRRPFAGRPRQG